MSIPTPQLPRQPTRHLSDTPFQVIFGNLINITGIGVEYAQAGYAPFSSPANQTSPVVALFITNTTTEDIFISFDGYNDHIIIPANSNNIPYNLLTNKRAAYGGIWTRSSAGAGSIYITYIM